MAKTATKKGTMIWRIYRFEQRFELPDDIRKSRRTPLNYTKDFVGSGQDNETINYSQQMMSLKLKANALMLIGAFHELKNIAANRSRCYRGFLLDEKFESANDEKIALWLGLRLAETRNILKNLEAVGLMEKVSMPKFDSSKDDFSGNGRPRAEISAHRRKSLNNKRNRKRKAKVLNKNRKRKTKQITKFETEFEKWKSAKEGKISQTMQSQSQTQGKNPSPKPNPTVSEAPGGKEQKFYTKISDVPLDSVFREDIEPQAMGFASEIYRLLKIPYLPGTMAAKQELFNYYNAWLNACDANLPEIVLKSLWNDSVKSARRIGDHKGRKGGYRKPGRGWRFEFNKNLAAYKAEKVLRVK